MLYFTMELVEGPSLEALLARKAALPERAPASRARSPSPSRTAHRRGLVHRDIKPANILLAPDGRARITDFGLVHEVSALSVTGSHLLLGTPAYMAPEQALGEPVDARSDLYSLGAVLYALVSGRPPYAGEVPAIVISRSSAGRTLPHARCAPDAP
jgi:serine/threonine-protein kinase